MDSRTLSTGDVSLQVVTEGEGPPVILLHGFPEVSFGWRRLMTPLAKAGFRAIAPDLRGYHQSEKPKGLEAYRVEQIVADVAGLIRALGYSRASIDFLRKVQPAPFVGVPSDSTIPLNRA